MFSDNLARILRASGSKTTTGRQKRAEPVLIRAYQPNQEFPHHATTFFSSCSKARRPSTNVSGLNCRLARTTISNERIVGKLHLNTSRIMRLATFLATALGMVLLLAMTPSREKPLSFFRAKTVNHLLLKQGSRNACSNSVRCLIRRCCGKASPAALDAKTYAALGSASRNNRPTPFGFHTNQESMGTFSFGDGRLVCAFHDIYSPEVVLENPLLQYLPRLMSSLIYLLWITFSLACRIG